MLNQITQGVKVSVEVSYDEEYSNPLDRAFHFGYRVLIENHNDFPVQVQRRHLDLFDSELGPESRGAYHRQLGGEGVAGAQPLIQPGSAYEYTSSVKQHSDLGTLSGTYLLQNLQTGTFFEVAIPRVALVGPHRAN